MAVHGLACHQPHVSFMSVFLCLSVSVCLSSYLTYTYTTWLFSNKWRIICSSFIKFEIITIWKNIVAWIGTYISEKIYILLQKRKIPLMVPNREGMNISFKLCSMITFQRRVTRELQPLYLVDHFKKSTTWGQEELINPAWKMPCDFLSRLWCCLLSLVNINSQI